MGSRKSLRSKEAAAAAMTTKPNRVDRISQMGEFGLDIKEGAALSCQR